jgi:hypothetical protein
MAPVLTSIAPTSGVVGVYIYDIEVTQTGNVYTVCKGKITIMRDVSYNSAP